MSEKIGALVVCIMLNERVTPSYNSVTFMPSASSSDAGGNAECGEWNKYCCFFAFRFIFSCSADITFVILHIIRWHI